MSGTKPTPPAASGFDAARHLDAMAPALGLTITSEQRPAVLQFLEIAHRMALLVETVPLDDGAFEMAAAFRPGMAGEGMTGDGAGA